MKVEQALALTADMLHRKTEENEMLKEENERLEYYNKDHNERFKNLSDKSYVVVSDRDAEIEKLKLEAKRREADLQGNILAREAEANSCRALYDELKREILSKDMAESMIIQTTPDAVKSVVKSFKHTIRLSKTGIVSHMLETKKLNGIIHHWQRKYDRLVDCIKRNDIAGLSLCDILSIHRENEKKLKEKRNV